MVKTISKIIMYRIAHGLSRGLESNQKPSNHFNGLILSF